MGKIPCDFNDSCWQLSLGMCTKEHLKFLLVTVLFLQPYIILSSYIFGIYVEKFASYNESCLIGTLLVLMFYI
jgi:hypothetical protein